MIELLRLSEASPIQERYIDGAMQSSQTLLRLIDDVLDLSKIEAGKLDLEHAPFYVPSLIDDVCGAFFDQARAKGLTLTTSISNELNAMLLGDAHRLRQILSNLVGNAVKFTATGGIAIAVTRLGDCRTAVRLRFTVADTGIGIAPSKHAAIFEAFGQADNSTTRRYGGTGLGLSIARELCRAMGGEIGVDSNAGNGSTFWFTVVLDKLQSPAGSSASVASNTAPQGELPTKDGLNPSAARQEFQESLRRAGRSTIHILLVEDNRANLRITKALLEAISCNVSTARNGLEAITAFRDARCDLILMDCQMPEMDGYEAAHKIRELETGRRTPIVALTADALDGSRELSLAAGMDDHLTKPLTLNVLTAKLIAWLGRSGETGVIPVTAADATGADSGRSW
jgi:CheY-like chemotaxis protein